MPEFTVKEVRLPELHLPEVKREDIVRTLSGGRMPEVDLARARRAVDAIPAVKLSSADVGRLLTAAATLARFVRPAPRRAPWRMGPFGRGRTSPIARIVQPRRRSSRRPLVLGGIALVAIAAWAVLRRPDVRSRISGAIRDARTRIDRGRPALDESAVTVHQPVAMVSTEAMPASEGTAPPSDGVGSEPADDAAAFEESATHS